jgi:hypothetical protein
MVARKQPNVAVYVHCLSRFHLAAFSWLESGCTDNHMAVNCYQVTWQSTWLLLKIPGIKWLFPWLTNSTKPYLRCQPFKALKFFSDHTQILFPTLQRTQSSSMTRAVRIKPFKEGIAVFCENHTARTYAHTHTHTHNAWTKFGLLSILKQVVYVVTIVI